MKINYDCPYMKLAAIIEDDLDCNRDNYYCCIDLSMQNIVSSDENYSKYSPFFTALFKPNEKEAREYDVYDTAWMSGRNTTKRADNISRIVALTLASLIMQEDNIANNFTP